MISGLENNKTIAKKIIYAIETKTKTKLRALKSEDLNEVLLIIKEYLEHSN